ncbi:receptor-like protein 12 [Dorcoceras hygrometricum]|uniref:Receptor-like protein 12 n=1 Tax=Dorcoceras hygrometricum TaxID=472368 RepID=A0A2Z7CZK5_9LAMI|nr:receptor-like protein 12 [Dorcoceras hygrometricum]
MAEYSPTDCSTVVRSAVVFSLSQHFAQQLFLCRLDTLRLVATLRYSCFSCVWDSMSTGYAIALKLATGSTVARDCWLSSRWSFQKLATGFPNDWLDQTMSYQLIQTTSFAMHPRLIEYNAVALDWMYCKTLSYQLIRMTSFCYRQLQTPTAGCTTTGYFLYDVASILRFSSQLLITEASCGMMTSLLMSSKLYAPADLLHRSSSSLRFFVASFLNSDY